MAATGMPHPEHDMHLCYLHNVGFLDSNLEAYKKFVTGAKYVCKKCGRAAVQEKNLCHPDPLA